jgi:hypothetical protein
MRAIRGLLEGTYIVSADRPLSDAEREALPDADRDVSIFLRFAQTRARCPQQRRTFA